MRSSIRWLMKAAVIAVFSLSSVVAAAKDRAQLTPAQEEAVVALARLYGVARYFCPSDVGPRVAWDRFLVHAIERALGAAGSGDIGPMLRDTFALLSRDIEISQRDFVAASVADLGDSVVVEWRHLGLGAGQRTTGNVYRSWRIGRDEIPRELHGEVEKPQNHKQPWKSFPLGGGWFARVRISLASAEALVDGAQDDAINRLSKEMPAWDSKLDAVPRSRSLAAGIAVWSVAKHFYPYWADVGVDWDSAFREWIQVQPEVQSRKDLLLGLRRLVAKLDDGHGGISDPAAATPTRYLPIAVRPLGDGYVVTATTVPDLAALGDKIETVNGRGISDVARELRERSAGAQHLKPWQARFELLSGEVDSSVKLGLRRGTELKEVELRYQAPELLREKRPAAIAALEPGIRYVDLSRFNRENFESALPELSAASTIIFDLRGYPTGDAFNLVSYWVTGTDDVKWMQIPIFARPFEAAAAFRPLGWNVKPKTGLTNARKILLVDPRAISYAESITGYFVAHAKGTLIGEATAGANGNVSTIDLPGGYTMRFTGMLVTSHDGRRFHAKGFEPDVHVVPTLEGIKAGRDEVLERALELARMEISSEDTRAISRL